MLYVLVSVLPYSCIPYWMYLVLHMSRDRFCRQHLLQEFLDPPRQQELVLFDLTYRKSSYMMKSLCISISTIYADFRPMFEISWHNLLVFHYLKFWTVYPFARKFCSVCHEKLKGKHWFLGDGELLKLSGVNNETPDVRGWIRANEWKRLLSHDVIIDIISNNFSQSFHHLLCRFLYLDLSS